jgi:hypothetical protein
MGNLLLRLAGWLPMLAVAASVYGGVIPTYTINHQAASEGMSFAEIYEIAGDPAAIEQSGGNPIRVEWVYQCATSGAGPCNVVDEDGQRRMRIHFQRGRLEIIRFERL